MKTTLSLTKLSPCICGAEPYGPVLIWGGRHWVRCEACRHIVGAFGKREARRVWNATMYGFSAALVKDMDAISAKAQKRRKE